LCYYCWKPGHFAKKCRGKQADEEKGIFQRSRPMPTHIKAQLSSSGGAPPKPSQSQQRENNNNRQAQQYQNQQSQQSAPGASQQQNIPQFHGESQYQTSHTPNRPFFSNMAITKNLHERPIALLSKVPTRKTWLADSACNVFISNDRTDFKDLHDLHQQIPVTVADDREVYASKGGTITLRNTSGQVNITEVIYVPEAPYSLFSIGAGVKQGFIPQFAEHGQKLIIHKDNFHLEGNLSENLLYELHTAIGTSHALSARTTTKDTSSLSKISTKRLHIRLGHPSSTIMRSIPGTKQVSFDSSRCEVCILSKMQSSSHDQSTKAEDILELLHLDLWGPESIESDGCKYWVGITDRKSGYRWVAGLRTKHATGVQTIFAKFKAQAELETGKKIKRIRVDEGTEFLKEMKRDWEQMGIKYEPTAAYSPESNGKAEVQNRILMNTVRAMLKQANMPPNFWLQALETAVYI